MTVATEIVVCMMRCRCCSRTCSNRLPITGHPLHGRGAEQHGCNPTASAAPLSPRTCLSSPVMLPSLLTSVLVVCAGAGLG